MSVSVPVRQLWHGPADLLNYLLKSRNLHRYLEIGIDHGDTYKLVKASYKVGVDPRVPCTFQGTSDEFWRDNTEVFDLIFIDGDHTSTQSFKDAANAICRIALNGAVVLHDTMPGEEGHQAVDIEIRKRNNLQPGLEVWNGDVWKTAVRFRFMNGVNLATWDCIHGCTVLLPRHNQSILDIDTKELTWQNYQQHKVEWLNIKDQKAMMEWLATERYK